MQNLNDDQKKIEQQNSEFNRNTAIACFLGVFIVIIWFLHSAIGWPIANPDSTIVKQQMQTIENSVAKDAEDKFYIAQRQGDKMQVYVQAQFVAAAYLQAKDEQNYDKWKAIQDSCGRVIGIK